MKYFLICIGTLLVMGCLENAREQKEVIDIARSEMAPEKKSIKINIPAYINETGTSDSKYNMFYIFDNGCSFCISQFIEIVNKFQSLKGENSDKTRYFFIAINKDTAKIRYYLDKYNISLTKNQYLLPDKDNEFVKKNPAITGKNEVNYILADSSYYPIVLGDPFYDFNSRSAYDSLGILKRNSAK